MPVDPSKIMEGIDHAAQMNDRWLFLAALVFILIAFSLAIWWLLKALERLQTESKLERTENRKELKEEREKSEIDRTAERERFLSIIDGYKHVIDSLDKSVEKNTETLEKHDSDMRKAHEVETTVLVRAELIRLGISPEILKKYPVG